MLPEANRVTRTPVPASHIMVGLQCGGSDGFSSITANPALGAAMDILVRHGGTAILSETPEIYGVEHTLTRRARSREIPITDTHITPDLPALPADTTDFDGAFDRLTVDQRAMLVLHHVHGYGVDEIAEWLGIPSGTVKWRLSRARRALAAQLDES
jgi:hypothetical protein